MGRTVRELIEGPDGQILGPHQLQAKRHIVVFEGAVRWVTDRGRFYVVPGSGLRFSLHDFGIVRVISTPSDYRILTYWSERLGADRDINLARFFVLDRAMFDRAFPSLLHRTFPALQQWRNGTGSLATMIGR